MFENHETVILIGFDWNDKTTGRYRILRGADWHDSRRKIKWDVLTLVAQDILDYPCTKEVTLTAFTPELYRDLREVLKRRRYLNTEDIIFKDEIDRMKDVQYYYYDFD